MKQNNERNNQNVSVENNRTIEKKSSMSTLILWNMTKALEINPNMDMKSALIVVERRLDASGYDVSKLIPSDAEGRHLACALLAWQQLGHHNADSLHQFYETRKSKNQERKCHKIDEMSSSPECSNYRSNLNSFENHNGFKYSKFRNETLKSTPSPVGPVIKLPVQAKIVMRLDTTSSARQTKPKEKPKDQEKDIMSKIEAACCIDSACLERLTALEATTNELRTRAVKLAQREAERVELLERAEASWKDLELGYQRRLTLAEEKEDDLAKQIKKLIEDRNAYKNDCTTLAEQLKTKMEAAEKDRSRLKDIEKQINTRACIRLKLSEEMSRGDAVLADVQCKAAQLTRDLRFKEEQTRRKLSAMSNEAESARALALEVERAMREELGALREQIANVSTQLLEEDLENSNLKDELEELRQTKMELVENLENCKVMCDDRMQAKLQELKDKKEQLLQLKEKVIDCQCKMPIDAAVEVKRTASLVAVCACSPDDKMESCSCSSLRTKLLSNLLTDLFRGLQDELGGIGSQMPCQLLKCLEDKQNWDRSSVVKTNLRNYFTKLLSGELDIAIGTSIEKYHAKWVAASCADKVKQTEENEDMTDSWEQRAIECRAHKLATQLADQLFQQQADQIVQQARDIVKSGNPCACKRSSAAFPCLVKMSPFDGEMLNNSTNTSNRFVTQDTTQYRVQIEDSKKMKRRDRAVITNDESRLKNEPSKKAAHGSQFEQSEQEITVMKKPPVENRLSRTRNKNITSPRNQPDKHPKVKHSYAVNLCLCDTEKKETSKVAHRGSSQPNTLSKDKTKQKVQRDPKDFVAPQISSIKQTKPINTITPSSEIDKLKKNGTLPKHRSCQSGCVCLHKVPSNTSIDALLKTLAMYKNEINNSSSPGENVEKKSAIRTSTQTSFNNNEKDSSDHRKEDQKNQDLVQKDSESIPKTTVSEFMGTINYEKSSKCIPSDVMKNENEILTNSNHSNDVLQSEHEVADERNYKCKDTADCHCAKNIESEKISSEQQTLLNMINDTNNHTQTSTKQSENSIKGQFLNGINETEDFENKSEKSSDKNLLCDCKFSINLLGVTLTDPVTREEKKQKSAKGKKNHQDHAIETKDSKPTKETTNDCIPENKINSKDKIQDSYTNSKSENISNIAQTKSMHDEEVSIVVNGTEKNNTNLLNSVQKVDSKDLEVNTFYLLEKYIKRKLQEFKSNCETNCFPLEDEEKIMVNILEKVKETIGEAECQMTCVCAPTEPTEGSWTRAYSLLQEYIKSKMKRAQCICALNENENMTTCMNDVLSRISVLIEQDFDRIKDLCKCKSQKSYEEIPEKDIYSTNTNIKLSDQNDNGRNTKLDSKLPSNTNEIIHIDSKDLQNNKLTSHCVSKSVGFNLCEDYNCRYRGKVSEKLVDTVLPNEPCYVPKTDLDTHFCMNKYDEIDKKDSNSKDLVEPFRNTMACDNRDSAKILPYIGCTIDCVCDEKVEQCCCTKSVVQENTSKIAEIWNTFLSKSSNKTSLIDNMLSFVYSNKNKEVISDKKNSHNDSSIEATDGVKTWPYIGCTISCNEKNVSAICTKLTVEDDTNKIAGLWNAFITENNISESVLSSMLSYVNSNKDSDKDVFEENQVCESVTTETSKTNDVILKVSAAESNVIENLDEMTCTHDGSDTLETCLSENDLEEWTEHQQPTKFENILDGTKPELIYNSENLLTKNVTFELQSEVCDCNKVPMCHVKLLVNNIEKKLMQSECTCDSLSSDVCPVHSLKHF